MIFALWYPASPEQPKIVRIVENEQPAPVRLDPLPYGRQQLRSIQAAPPGLAFSKQLIIPRKRRFVVGVDPEHRAGQVAAPAVGILKRDPHPQRPQSAALW